MDDTTTGPWVSRSPGWEIVQVFLTLGALSPSGPGLTGVLQTEVQEKRGWLSQARFVEGVALVNMLPGPSGAQMSLFLGYIRAGWWGGLLAGLCFLLPSFVVMLILTLLYTPTMARCRACAACSRGSTRWWWVSSRWPSIGSVGRPSPMSPKGCWHWRAPWPWG